MADLHGQGVKVCIGFHPSPRKQPKQYFSETNLIKMKKLLELPGVSGLGEVGIDHTAHQSEWSYQQKFLHKILPFLQQHHVLVLHCRGQRTENPSEVFNTVLKYLKDRVPRKQSIHVHCFTGSSEVVKSWLRAFPKTCFGFTRIVRSFTEEQLEGLRTVSDERILLETDAPYFNFPGHSTRHTAPNLIGMTAEVVAVARGTTAKELLRITSVNASKLYGGYMMTAI